MRTARNLLPFVLAAAVACSPTERDSTSSSTDAPAAGANQDARGATPASARVTINGRELDAAARAEFQRTYQTTLPAGDYWYDAKSGAIGVRGQGIGGFLRPGHEYGRIAEDCSSGDTGVIVNGRALPLNECVYLSHVLGVQVMPGRYWIDARGNYGFEGFDAPMGNLALSGGGGGSGGDNYWSSRYAAGNSNADNSAGYVYIPGTGTVSYGL